MLRGYVGRYRQDWRSKTGVCRVDCLGSDTEREPLGKDEGDKEREDKGSGNHGIMIGQTVTAGDATVGPEVRRCGRTCRGGGGAVGSEWGDPSVCHCHRREVRMRMRSQ